MKQIERLWSPEGEGGGNGAGASDAGNGGDGGANAGADAGANGAGADGAGKGPSAADIAARSGGAFARRSGKAGDGNGAGGGDDGVDPRTKPAADKSGWPEWLPEKFRGKAKGEVNAQAMAEAYSTLESNFARMKDQKGFGKAGEKPEDYVRELKVPEDAKLDHIRKIDIATDPAVGVFRKVAHKHKIPVDAATGLMLDFLTELNPLMPAPQSEEDIIKELGEGGAALRDTLGTWLEGQFTSKVFSEDELEFAYNVFGGSATGLRLLAKVREMTGERPIPANPGRVADGLPSIEEWYAMNTDPRMKTDVAFRNKVEAFGEQLFGDEPAGSSEPGVGMPPPRKVDRRERASTRT